MKNALLILGVLLQFNVYADDVATAPADVSVQPEQVVAADENCQDMLNFQVALIDENERLIAKMVAQKEEDLTQYDISVLEKGLIHRYSHLQHVREAYTAQIDEPAKCSPTILGDAIAIYDYTQLGSRALTDTKMRRIVNSIVKSPRNKLATLKKDYSHFTSSRTISDFLEQLNEQKVSLPSNMNIDPSIKDGHFSAPSDVAIKGVSTAVVGFAKVWGFISDKLKWRNGHLNKNQDVLNAMKANLKPLDLIYEKRTFVLSNYTIPGHFGHVAVWLGTKEELIAAGVWDKEFFEPFRKEVEAGRNIVEVRKKGMDFVSLEDFTNLDEIAVTRVTKARDRIEEIMENLVDEMDATYDFAFNALSDDKLTCAEMIAYSYGDIHWPGMKTILSVSLRPDDMGVLSLYENSPEEFILYFVGNKDNSATQKSFDDWKKLFKIKQGTDLLYK